MTTITNSSNQFIDNYATSSENERIIYYKKECSNQWIEILDYRKMFFSDLKQSIQSKRTLQFSFTPNRNRGIDIKSVFFYLHKEVAQDVWEIENSQIGDICPICGNDYSQDEKLPTSLVLSGSFMYDITTRTQKLVAILCMCRKCHYTRNLDRVDRETEKATFESLIKHYSTVNKIDVDKAIIEFESSLNEFETQHKKEVYKLDFLKMNEKYDFPEYPSDLNDENFSMFMIEYVDDDMQKVLVN